MTELALKIWREADAEPAVTPKPAPGPQIVADPLNWNPLAKLIEVWPDGPTHAAKERGAQRYCEGLAENLQTANLVRKRFGRWEVSPLAPDPTAPPESGATIRDFLFLRTGEIPRDLLGVFIPATLAEQIPTWTESKRRRFYGMCDLSRQLDEHNQRFPGIGRDERDGLFRSDPERQRFCREHGITRWRARTVREFRCKTEWGRNWDPRGRPRHDEDSIAAVFDPEAQAYIRTELCRTQRKLPAVYRSAVVLADAHGWKLPSLRSVRRWADDNLPPAVRDYHRLGKRKWAAKHAPFIERDLTAQYPPNQCWVGDHHQFDFWVVHKGKPVRPWLTAWMDMGSRRLVGWWISFGPNADTLLAAFRMAVLANGAPAEILVDNGKDYRSAGVVGKRAKLDEERINGVMGRLGVSVHWAIPYHPQSKPVERFFGRVCEEFSKSFASYCGKDPQSRPDGLSEQLRKGTIGLRSQDEVRDLFAAWVEVYRASPHSGLGMNGRTPNDVFSVNPIPCRTAPREVLDLLLMRVERVKVGRNGVRYSGIHYGQSDLTLFRLQGQLVDIRIDPTDAAVVYVQDLEGRFITAARNERLRGVTPDEVREGARRRGAAAKLARSACAATQDRFRSVEDHARELAAERRYLDGQAVQRKAVGAEGQTEPDVRGIQLLPGAATAAQSLRALGRGRPEPKPRAASNGHRSGLERLIERGRQDEAREAAREESPRGSTRAQRFAQLYREEGLAAQAAEINPLDELPELVPELTGLTFVHPLDEEPTHGENEPGGLDFGGGEAEDGAATGQGGASA